MTKLALRQGSRQRFAVPDGWVRRWRAEGGRLVGDLPDVEVSEPTPYPFAAAPVEVSPPPPTSPDEAGAVAPSAKRRPRKRPA